MTNTIPRRHFNGLITFFIIDNPVFSNGSRSLPRNPPTCIVLDNWVFGNLISVDELFAKALGRFVTSPLVNNNLWGKLVSLSELPIIFDDNLKSTSASSFIAEFNLLNCELDSFAIALNIDKMISHSITHQQNFYNFS